MTISGVEYVSETSLTHTAIRENTKAATSIQRDCMKRPEKNKKTKKEETVILYRFGSLTSFTLQIQMEKAVSLFQTEADRMSREIHFSGLKRRKTQSENA